LIVLLIIEYKIFTLEHYKELIASSHQEFEPGPPYIP